MDISYLLLGLNITLIILIIFLIINNHKLMTKINILEYSDKDISSVITREMSNSRIEIEAKLGNLENRLSENINNLTTKQMEQLNLSNKNNAEILKMVEDRLESVRSTVDTKLRHIQEDNNTKLNEIKSTVDEKLHKTLEEKLGESFKLVSMNLESVHKGLGEMQNLAKGVGDLKKVLTNVKTRGIIGEIQLEAILEQILTPEQYEKNVKCNPNSSEIVEFAIKLPGNKENKAIMLPIDAKFPIEAYYRLLDAHEKFNSREIALYQKELEQAIKKSAKDINQKYICSPFTTEFAIMFLPIEGLYAEIVRSPELLSNLQNQYKVIVAGPTTFSALLNSLQIGFKTLAIEKRSMQVWETLTRVRDEFGKFGEVLEKAQKKIVDAGSEIDKLVGIRSKKIIQQLDKVGEYNELE
ncbi:MAG: DNA recombination protein RmuC [Filifactoraceae bacterium]